MGRMHAIDGITYAREYELRQRVEELEKQLAEIHEISQPYTRSENAGITGYIAWNRVHTLSRKRAEKA